MAAGHFKYGTDYFAINKACVSIPHYISILWCWNDFWSVNFLQTPDKWTFILGISALKEIGYIPWNKMMAITTLLSIPPLIVFFLAQDKLIGGLATTG